MRATPGQGARREQSKRYYEANRESIIEKQHAAYLEHRAERRAAAALYRAGHQDEIAEAGKIYRDGNRAKINAKQRAYRLANPGKIAANKKRWHEEHREQDAARKAAWVLANRDRVRDNYLRAHHGISLAEYRAILARQGGVCGSCAGPATGRSGTFHVDHDHQTGSIRGLLCDSCNLAIGKLGDTVEGVEGALEYLIAARRRAAVWTEVIA